MDHLSSLNNELSPSKQELAPLLHDVRNVVLGRSVHSAKDYSEQVRSGFTEQIRRALEQTSTEKRSADDASARFLNSLEAVQNALRYDIQAAFDNDPAVTDIREIVLAYPGIDAVAAYRLANVLHRMGIPLLPRMMTEIAHSETGIDIHPGATIGQGFFIDHGTGVVIGATSDIGKNVVMYQGVTLGAISFPKDADGNIIRGKKRHPTIGNDVKLYANATVLGDITVGDRSVIGGNVWLTESVPPDTTVTIGKPDLRVRKPQV